MLLHRNETGATTSQVVSKYANIYTHTKISLHLKRLEWLATPHLHPQDPGQPTILDRANASKSQSKFGPRGGAARKVDIQSLFLRCISRAGHSFKQSFVPSTERSFHAPWLCNIALSRAHGRHQQIVLQHVKLQSLSRYSWWQRRELGTENANLHSCGERLYFLPNFLRHSDWLMLHTFFPVQTPIGSRTRTSRSTYHTILSAHTIILATSLATIAALRMSFSQSPLYKVLHLGLKCTRVPLKNCGTRLAHYMRCLCCIAAILTCARGRTHCRRRKTRTVQLETPRVFAVALIHHFPRLLIRRRHRWWRWNRCG